jgi:ribosomal protein S27E
MIKEGCPGSKEIRSPYPEEIRCPFCGHKNEIWSDETEISCRGCAVTINRQLKPTCIEWCPAAKECVGAEKYKRLMKAARKG